MLHKTTIRTLAALAALSLLGALPAAAHGFKVGTLEIHHPWTRATPPSAPSAGGYLEIVNTGSEPDRLVGASAGFADVAQIHEMKMNGDVMTMRELPEGIEIPAGGKVVLAPNGLHVMFLKLHHGLKQGDSEEGTLRFEKAGEVAVEWKVEAAGTKSAGHDGH